MRALVTGATGFVGRYLVARLLARGDEVTALVRDAGTGARVLGQGIETVTCDLTGPAPHRGLLEGHDVLLHLACARKGTFASGRADSEAFRAVNTLGTLALARAWKEAGGGRFVLVSSTAAMGPPESLPITEDAPCHPHTPYGRSKREAEEGLEALVAEGLDAVVLRPCLVVGQGKVGGEIHTMLGLVARGLFPLFRGFENARKPLVAAADLADAILAAALRGSKGAAYLVTCGIDHPLRRIVDTAAHLLGRDRGHVELPYAPFRLTAGLFGVVGAVTGLPVPLTPARLEIFVADRTYSIERARRELGFEPRVTSLEDLLKPEVDDFVAARADAAA